MIAKREIYLSRIMIGAQVLLSIFIFWLVDFIFPHVNVGQFDQLFYYSQIAIIWTFLLIQFKMGTIFRLKKLINLIEGYFVMVAIGGFTLMIETLLARLIGYEGYPLWNILYFSVFSFVSLVLFKLLFYNIVLLLRRNDKNKRFIILIADNKSKSFIDRLKASKDWGYTVVSIISPNKKFAERYKNAVYIETNEELKSFITQNVVDEILYCLPLSDKHYDVQTVIKDTEEVGITLYLVQESFLKKIKTANDNEDMQLKLALDQKTGYTRYFWYEVKTFFDMGFSSIILVLLSPLFLIVAALIKLEDGGPIFFAQQRIGLHGRRFMCYKFRTMVVNAEAMQAKLQKLNEVDGPVFKIKHDPRITRIGKFLRKTSIDELPQFFNVIKGEMAIVGPRPPLLSEVQQYEYFQLRRLSMKPGLTCIWQVEGRNLVTFDEWITMDLRYIDNWSIWLDIKLIFKTIFVVFKGSGS